MTPRRTDPVRRLERRAPSAAGERSAGRRIGPADLLLVPAGVLVALGLLELALRLLAPQPLETPLDVYAADPRYGHVFAANLENRVLATTEWTLRLSTTGRGFRRGAAGDAEPLTGARPGTRIVGIGDSFMFGYGVDYELSALASAGELLARRTGRRVETVNLGIPGHNVTHYLAVLRGETPALHPDVVVVMLYANDLRRRADLTPYAVGAGGHLISERFSLRSPRSALLPIRGFLKTRSHAYLLLRDRFAGLWQRLGLRPLAEPGGYRRDLDLQESFAYTFDTIRRIHRFCSRSHIRLLICLVPEKPQIVESYRRRVLAGYPDADQLDWRLPQDTWLRFCRLEAIECLDLAPALERAERSAATYFEVDLHWTRDGQAAAGEELARRLIELGWLTADG